MSNTTRTIRRHKFYPLILIHDGPNNRRLTRNREFDNKHNPLKLHILYGRQVGKLLSHKRPLALPYSIQNLECDAWPSCDCELEYLKHLPKDKPKKPIAQFDPELAEMGGGDE